MFDDFMVRAAMSIAILSMLTGPLGTVAIWRRMGYFGDAAAHAALLGVALSLLASVSVIWGGILLAVIMGFYLGGIDGHKRSPDAILGVIAHGSLAVALLVAGLSSKIRGNLDGYLFGDILSISKLELAQIALWAVLIVTLLAWRWSRIMIVTLNREIAASHGINPRLETRIFVILLALAVAVGIKSVGALLIGAFLVIPAISARGFAKSPEQMALIAVVISLLSGAAGLWLSYQFGLQTGPSIVACSVVFFIVSQLKRN